MASKIEEKLMQAGIELPAAPNPAGMYVPCRRAGRMVHVSGQVSIGQSGEVRGKLGETLDVEQGREAAQICAVNMLSQLRAFCDGDLDRVAGCVELRGFVNATPEFEDHPKVVNGASEVMAKAFGEAGAHTRAAVGVASLPMGVAVEVAGLFELAGD